MWNPCVLNSKEEVAGPQRIMDNLLGNLAFIKKAIDAPVNPFPMEEARLPRMVKLDLLLALRKSLFLLIVGVSLIGITTSVSTNPSGIWKVRWRELRDVETSDEGTWRADVVNTPRRRFLSLEDVRSGVDGGRGVESGVLSLMP